ncbi:hypothetical protein IWW41_003794, partial [Coemansia sp. RSA 2522]
SWVSCRPRRLICSASCRPRLQHQQPPWIRSRLMKARSAGRSTRTRWPPRSSAMASASSTLMQSSYARSSVRSSP